MFSLWLRRGSFCETVSMETLEKYERIGQVEQTQWNPFRSPFYGLWCPGIFCFFWFWGLKMLHLSFCTASATSGHRVAPTQGGGLCFLHNSTSRTVVLISPGVWGSEVKESMLCLLCLLLFSPWWKLSSVNVIVFYLFYNGYLTKGLAFLLYRSSNREPLKI